VNVRHGLRAAIRSAVFLGVVIEPGRMKMVVPAAVIVAMTIDGVAGQARRGFDGVDGMVGGRRMGVRRRRRQRPELGDGERQDHAQKASRPNHNASLPPILYPGMKACRRAARKIARNARFWPALVKAWRTCHGVSPLPADAAGFRSAAGRRVTALELAILIFLVLLNGVFAMSELAIVSAKKPRLKASADRGDRGAKAALKLLDDPSRMLSTVQIGITLIGIIAGAYGATALADDLAPVIVANVPTLSAWADDIAFGIVIVLTTYLSLVLGELVPKRIALSAPEAIAGLVAPAMSGLATASGPFVWVLKASTDGLLTILGLNKAREADVTEEEIHSLIEEGHSAGLIEPEERSMITGVMRLGDRTVRAIMTPRPDIVWLDPNKSDDENLARIRDSGHSRFPLAEADIDHVIGIVQTKELLTLAGQSMDLRAAMHPPVIVPESLSVLRLLDSMRGNPVRMVFVADEYGAIQGLVTAADLLEAIAGSGALSADEAISAPVRREDGSWLVDGMMPIDEFERLVETPGLAEEGQFDTLAGLVISLTQKLPSVGDVAERWPLAFEIVDLDGRRIDKVIVRRLSDDAQI
jgi:putative hemolysin